MNKSKSEENLESQVERLAEFIMRNVPSEPSQNEGAIDTAIRILRRLIESQAEVDMKIVEMMADELRQMTHCNPDEMVDKLIAIFRTINVRIKEGK